MAKEIESKFEVLLTDFEKIKKYLTQVDIIGQYSLAEVKNEEYHDHYFDFGDYYFFNQGGSLRIRISSNSDVKITLKDTGRTTETGQIERVEIEGEPDVDLLNEIVDSIKKLRPSINEIGHIKNSDLATKGIIGIFNEIGASDLFVAISKRLKRKIIFNHQIIGEISLDEVLYKKNYTESNYIELEIETLNEIGLDAVILISNHLKQLFPLLISTTISKYYRGKEFLYNNDYHKSESKYIIESEEIFIKIKNDFAKRNSSLGEYEIGKLIEYDIIDSYYDFPDNLLNHNNAYFRLRKVKGKPDEFTFREYKINNNNHIVDVMQIKSEANRRTLVEVIDYLNNKKLIGKDVFSILSLNINEDIDICLSAIKLKLLLSAQIHRAVYPIYLERSHIASIKLDQVGFNKFDRTITHYECEVSTGTDSDDHQDALHEIGSTLRRKYKIHSTVRPKVELGLAIEEKNYFDVSHNNEIIIHKRKNLTLQDFIQINRGIHETEKLNYEKIITDYERLIVYIEKILNLVTTGKTFDERKVVIENLLVKSLDSIQDNLTEKLAVLVKKLANAEVSSVINELLDYCVKNNLTETIELVNLSARLKRIEKDIQTGVRKHEDLQPELNSINSSLLQIINHLKLKFKNSTEQSLPEVYS